MDPQTRIEEAHGLWELAVARLAAMAETGAGERCVAEAVTVERAAFKYWKEVSERAIAQSEKKG